MNDLQVAGLRQTVLGPDEDPQNWRSAKSGDSSHTERVRVKLMGGETHRFTIQAERTRADLHAAQVQHAWHWLLANLYADSAGCLTVIRMVLEEV